MLETYLKKLRDWALFYDKSLIIEMNDFINGNLTLSQELQDLIDSEGIDDERINQMRTYRTVWSVRYTADHEVVIEYSYTLEDALKRMCDKLRL